MGFFYRKSQKLGPFRINLSKSGIGFSTGVKGARVSVGPNGTFVHLGSNGVYYRKKVSSTKRKNNSVEEVDLNSIYASLEGTTKIETTNFDSITDVDSEDFIRTLEKQDKKLFLYKWLGILPLIICTFAIFQQNAPDSINQERLNELFIVTSEGANIRSKPSKSGEILEVAQKNDSFNTINKVNNWYQIKTIDTIGFVHQSVGKTENVIQEAKNSNSSSNDFSFYSLLVFIPIIGLLYLNDKKRKRVDIIYSMDEEFLTLFNYQKQYFKEFQNNRKIWQQKLTKGISNSKYHGGANTLIKRIPVKKTEIDSLPTPLINTNVEIPHISLSNIDLYFFPERLVLKRNNNFAAIFYKNLEIIESSTRFIEDNSVPKDASIIANTWKYVNKSGGPDRRFNDNRQIPICNYYEYNFKCKNGINEVIMTSKIEGMHNFSDFINRVGKYQLEFEK